MNVAVLALQGAFLEHEQMLHQIGVDCFEVRQPKDWQKPKDALILPGGESTVQTKLLRELQLFDAVKNDIEAGLPVFGTCAGLILLAREENGTKAERLGTMDISVKRNAFGRQLGSFATISDFDGVGTDVPMTFIRAPYIDKVGQGVKVLAQIDGHVVAARQGRQLVTAFHPELNTDERIHRYFLDIVAGSK